ncbi:MAG: ATP-binding protein [Chloroflexota bacterium]|nr:ATP-binding protein [Chloroflexota bacterium]
MSSEITYSRELADQFKQAQELALTLPSSIGELHALWRQYVETGRVDARVRPQVREAWERCRDYGLDPRELPLQSVDDEELRQAQEHNRRLLEIADPFLRTVHVSLENQPHLVALADAEGTILRLLADPVAQARGQRANLFEGASWHERDIGCNGVGTALATQVPVILVGPEHFLEAYATWTCVGFPLHYPDGSLAGVLDLSVPNECASIHTSGWLLSIAHAIELGLASEAHHRSLMGAAADTILVADAEGRYVDVNPAATELLGYSRDELLQLRVADVVAAGPTWTEAEYARFLEEGYWQGELELRRRDGSLVPVEARASTVALPTEVVYLSVIRDISERRAMERLQREFLAMVTHDLKSPLTSLKGHAELMRRRGTYDERALDVIITQASRLDRLIGDLLDVARLVAEPLALERCETDLVALVRASAEQAQALTSLHTIRIEAPSASCTGWWDSDRLAQVLQNLLVNAIKYSLDGGEIVVRVEDCGQEVQVAVVDQGIGIAPEAQAHLFERFYRTTDARAHNEGGLGLGLYISKTIVEHHGGRIWVESQVGKGSTFTFSLPYTVPEEDHNSEQ